MNSTSAHCARSIFKAAFTAPIARSVAPAAAATIWLWGSVSSVTLPNLGSPLSSTSLSVSHATTPTTQPRARAVSLPTTSPPTTAPSAARPCPTASPAQAQSSAPSASPVTTSPPTALPASNATLLWPTAPHATLIGYAWPARRVTTSMGVTMSVSGAVRLMQTARAA
jgi:hypothetical protein